MVRNYKRKTERASQYSQNDLQTAVAEIKRGVMTIYRAHKLYKIPKTTLFYHVTGTRGLKSKTQGRAPAIPVEDEKRLAEGLKTMERWGFGLSRNELLNTVADFVAKNKIKTPFKNNIPGNEWFFNFKKRHHLSIKKPQAVEYSRKKMTDPFVINEYFNLLNETLRNLDLFNRPELIWNLDETSLSHDPHKTKVVGARGKPSSRTTSGPGRENTTVLSAVSASGIKAPPLIIFKGKNVWDSWLSVDQHSFPGTAYAASPNGWMEANIFLKYFEKTLLPALGPIRPALVIYDGHSTHVNISLIELARANDVTILKLPPHTSHLLQPLDLSVFKSVKDSWDSKLVAWQRKNIGLKIPKRTLSELIGQTWKEVNPEILRNGFRKAGIHPFNSNAVPEDKYDPEALKRFKISKQQLSKNQANNSVPQENGQNIITAEPSTSSIPQESDQNIIMTEPSTSSVESSFEQLLLNTIKQTQRDEHSLKRKRIATGAEVITSQEALTRLAKEKEEKERGKNRNRKNNPKSSKKTKRAKRKCSSSSSSSEEEMDEPVFMDSDADMDPEVFEDDEIGEQESEIAIGRWVIVKYASKKSIKHFVGQIGNKNEEGWLVNFLKYTHNTFTWPEIEDSDTVVDEDIVRVLPEPFKSRRDTLSFEVDFATFHL